MGVRLSGRCLLKDNIRKVALAEMFGFCGRVIIFGGELLLDGTGWKGLPRDGMTGGEATIKVQYKFIGL